MKKIVFSLIVFALIFLFGCSHVADPSTSQKVPDPGFEDTSKMIVKDSSSLEDEPPGRIKEFSIIAKQWAFEPSTIRVDKGDMVKLSIQSVDVKHGIALPDFGINSRLDPGLTTLIEFVADKTGTFTFFCSVQCGSGHGAMRGSLIVK
jgi:cytochrome c oxidase subunit II